MAKKTTTPRPRKTAAKSDSARKLAVQMARLALDTNCEDIVVLDLRGKSPITDYFVIATGTSDRQIRSTADDMADLGREIGQRAWQVAGLEKADWVVLDFVDVMVHLFDESHRKYYDLELIWGESPRVRWRRPARAKKAQDSQDE